MICPSCKNEMDPHLFYPFRYFCKNLVELCPVRYIVIEYRTDGMYWPEIPERDKIGLMALTQNTLNRELKEEEIEEIKKRYNIK